MKTPDLMRRLAISFQWWRNLIVPNVYLGDRTDEMDLAIVSKSGLLWEVEVKASMADWRADIDKRKWKCARYDDASPARFYYAVPQEFVGKKAEATYCARSTYVFPEWLPIHAGVLLVNEDRIFTARTARALHRKPLSQKLVSELQQKLGMRYWRHVAPLLDASATAPTTMGET